MDGGSMCAMSGKRHCCYIPCSETAEYMAAWHPGMPDNYTDACADHLGHLLGDNEVPATVYRIREVADAG